jgi:hypothetical protein
MVTPDLTADRRIMHEESWGFAMLEVEGHPI